MSKIQDFIKKHIQPVLEGAVVIFMLLIVLYTAVITKNNHDLNKYVNVQDSTIEMYKTFRAGDNEVISRQEQQIIDMERYEKDDAKLIAELKARGITDASIIINLQTENKRLKLELSYKPTGHVDTVVINTGPNPGTYLKVPQIFGYKDQWLSATGIVGTVGITLDSIVMNNQPQLVIGWTGGFFKKSQPVIDYSDKCPYVRVTSMKNIVVVKDPPFYKKPWFYRLEGAALFFGIDYGLKKISTGK
jgi:hypothetical protein